MDLDVHLFFLSFFIYSIYIPRTSLDFGLVTLRQRSPHALEIDYAVDVQGALKGWTGSE